MSDFAFFADEHVYLLDGVELPSVTHICRFLAYKAEYADRSARDSAAARGTAIHDAIATMLLGGQATVNAELMPYIRAYQAWASDYRIRPLYVERMLYAQQTHRCAGTIDLICETGGKRVLVDYKTGQINKLALAAQLDGYAMLLRENGELVDARIGVKLHRDGKYTVYQPPSRLDGIFEQLWTLHTQEEQERKQWKTTI
jgi:ATP-dependent exoDNAse (exonuclease V) beta subunit